MTAPFVLARGPMRRTMDPRRLTAIANHPEVRPFIGASGPVDLAELLTNPAHLAFESPNGGIIAIAIGSGRYDIHTLFLPEGRGKEAFDTIREVARYMFTCTDCTEGRTTVPTSYRAAAVAARHVGFQTLFTSPLPYVGEMGQTEQVDCDCMTLTLDRWTLTSPWPVEAGAWFHRFLEEAKQEHGGTTPIHADDPIHDRYVGATVLMIQGGQVEKAVRFYNVWAHCAHYAPITLVRRFPIVLDVQDAVLELGPEGLEVLSCR